MHNQPRTSGPVSLRLLAFLTMAIGLIGTLAATATTTASAASFTYDVRGIARVDIRGCEAAGASPTQVSVARDGSASLVVEARFPSTTPKPAVVATNTATSRTFGIADRVAGQLDDVRLGSLRGQLGPDDLQRLVNARGAQRYYDTATGNINVIQQVDDVLLRITTASDEFKIISVGPIRPNQVTNGVTNGRFVPIGGAG